MADWDELEVDVMVGKTMKSVTGEVGSEEVIFETVDGETFRLYHDRDCCESVTVEDIAGDLSDLVGAPILQAEEVSNHDDPPFKDGYTPDSFTWTFYKFATIKGYVTIRWLGESNGYYSEAVNFEQTGRKEGGA
jgi:hypothetical protein